MILDLKNNYQDIPWCRKSIQRKLKRIFDIVGGIFIFLLIWPILVITALAVKLTSRGPVILRQTRIGIYGRQFKMYKFRSMCADNADGTSNYKGDVTINSPHLTPIGGFIRAWRFDELPQLWNILLGDMSFVGPRADMYCNLNCYEKEHMIAFLMPPGATALTAIKGGYSVDWITRRKINVEYVKDWNFLLDLKIIAETILFILRQKGTVPINELDLSLKKKEVKKSLESNNWES